MKKLVFIAFSACFAAFTSCKEHANLGVVLTGGGSSTGDSTFMSSVEAVSAKKIVVEEFTGASCPNCPDARTMLATIEAANPNKIIPIELHPHEIPQGRKIEGKSKYDFTNTFVSDIIAQYYQGIGSIPIAGIDRYSYNNSRLINRADWANIIATRIAQIPPVNIKLTNQYDDGKREGNLKVHVAYTKTLTGKQFISLAIVESDIVDAQEYPSYIDDNYNFKHVFRKIVTPAGGTSFLDSLTSKTAGRVFQTNFKYAIDPSWNPANCKLILMVHNNQADSKEILQAEEIEVK